MELEKFQEVTGEKYEYIFKSSDYGKWYSDVKFYVEDVEKSAKGGISGFYLEFQGDYQKSCDGDAYSVGYMLKNIADEISAFIGFYPINPDTLKYDKSFDKFYVEEAVVMNFEYKIDERHFVDLSYHIVYEDK
jgi:hypothetical protein